MEAVLLFSRKCDGIWGWEEKKDLEKIMLDYVRWLFKLDFCTPRYIVMRELRIDKLKIK